MRGYKCYRLTSEMTKVKSSEYSPAAMASRHSRAVIFGAVRGIIHTVFSINTAKAKHNSSVSEVLYCQRSYPSCLLSQHHLVLGGMKWISVSFLWAGV